MGTAVPTLLRLVRVTAAAGRWWCSRFTRADVTTAGRRALRWLTDREQIPGGFPLLHGRKTCGSAGRRALHSRGVPSPRTFTLGHAEGE